MKKCLILVMVICNLLMGCEGKINGREVVDTFEDDKEVDACGIYLNFHREYIGERSGYWWTSIDVSSSYDQTVTLRLFDGNRIVLDRYIYRLANSTLTFNVEEDTWITMQLHYKEAGGEARICNADFGL